MKRILVVEDDNSLSVLLRLIMKVQQEDWDVSSAATGVEALSQVEKFHPDLILLDIMMPEMDGLEVARRLHGDERYKDQKIVILSALNDAETQRKAKEAGVLEYWTKPISPDELREGMLRVLGPEEGDLL
ncbi:Sporulation initiation phosphotransferase F [Thermoflexales bacterium]|nr:Sporulation initiation phosphotransferase F [Thermoflexales bacterium]